MQRNKAVLLHDKVTSIFLTGISGFVGGNLAGKILSHSSQIYALVRKPIEYTDKAVKTVEGDILKPESFISVMKKCEVIFHCAAYVSFQKKDFRKAYQVNVEGTRNILESAYQAGVKKVIHLSACSVLGYSNNNKEIIDESANPVIEKGNVYAYTKKLAEKEVKKYVQKGLDVSIANIATVYGPGDKKMNSGSIIKAIYENKIRFAPPGGTSYVTVNDLVDGLIVLAKKGKSGERYIFCNENLTFLQLFNRITKVLGRNEIRFKIPRWTYVPVVMAGCIKDSVIGSNDRKTNLATAQIIKESYNYKYYSSQKAKNELGWKPRSSLEEAVGGAFKYYRREGLISDR